MGAALRQARAARRNGEVPIGAIVVVSGRVVGRGANRPVAARDPTAHAEVMALRRAARKTRDYRLGGATLYVTLEPCLVYGARDPKIGATRLLRQSRAARLNHRFQVTGDVRAEECASLLRDFFREKRRVRNAEAPRRDVPS